MSDLHGGIVAGVHTPHTTHFAATCAGSVWWVADQLARYGPRWELVPPIVLAVASLLGALRSYADGRQARRHAEDLHRAELRRMIRPFRGVDPTSNGSADPAH